VNSNAVYSTGASATTSTTLAASLTHDGASFWFCSGFEVTSGGATGGGVVNATLSGILGGTQTYKFPVPTGVTVAAAPLTVQFNPPLPSVDVNTDITLNLGAPGAGNTGVAISLHGFKGQRQLG